MNTEDNMEPNIWAEVLKEMEKFAEDVEKGDLSGYKTTTPDDLRAYLKSKGWSRRDRRNIELWVSPFPDRLGYTPRGVSLTSALKRQAKLDRAE